jgi:uncharacterized protein YjiS (DUF1127 family)
MRNPEKDIPMATATLTAPAQTGFLSGLAASVKGYFARRATYRQVTDELHRLTDRELNDIGLHRGMIRHIATESAYGKTA